MNDQSATLALIRHGETEWSLSGQHTGRTDIALTAHGEDEARALAPALAAYRFDHAFTSPSQRARRTCDLSGVAAARIEPDLVEWDYGTYEGKRTAEIEQLRPGWSLYRDGGPDGETADQVAQRADRLIAKMEALGGTIALFSHGHFGCSLAARWIGLPILAAQHFFLNTASISILGMHPRRRRLRVIALWNSTVQ